MERIKILLDHIIQTAKIKGYEDVEIAAKVFLGSIEKNCVDEFSAKCEDFTKQKVQEIMFLEKIEKMINLN
jgi:hypothetical protein